MTKNDPFKASKSDASRSKPELLVEGVDYTIGAGGFFVFTRAYHLRRGSCCQSGCRHCPYGIKKNQEAQEKECESSR